MDKKTKKLHELMQRHGLSVDDVAGILGREPSTVKVWRVKNTPRPIPSDALELLQLKLAARGVAA